MKKKLNYIFYSGLTTIVFLMDLSLPMEGNLLSLSHNALAIVTGYKGYNVLGFVLLIFLYNFYKKSIQIYVKYHQDIRSRICCIIPAFLFSAFMVFGYAFETTNSWHIIFAWGNSLQLFKVCIALVGYFVFFMFSVSDVFYLFNMIQKIERRRMYTDSMAIKLRFYERILVKYVNLLSEHPFKTVCVTLLIAYLPALIVSFPGLVMVDPVDEICQVFGVATGTSDYLHLMNENILLNNHHPITYTLLIKVCLWIGHMLFHSYNLGLFLVCLIQISLFIMAIGYLITCLLQYSDSKKIAMGLLVYVVLSPRIQSYIVLLTKDVLYAASIVFCSTCLFQMIHFEESKKVYIIGGASLTLGVLLRNDSIYMLVISFLIIMIFKKQFRKKLCMMIVGIVAIHVLVNSVLLPAFSITPGSVREALSIPFQQTARYLKEAGQEVTVEEKEAIAAVLDYDSLAEVYTPTISDNVKATYNEMATRKELIAYFKVWFRMFLKHPGIYMEATLNNCYAYFYPSTSDFFSYDDSLVNYRKLNEKIGELTQERLGHFERMEKYGLMFDKIRESINYLPGLFILQSSATYTWVLILWVFYCINKKKKDALLCTIPFILIMLICVASPVNGWYFRYVFSLASALPGIIALNYCSFVTDVDKRTII